MAERAHTPGQWDSAHRRDDDGQYRTQVFPSNDPDNTIATVHWHSVPTARGLTTDREANARLIAAAPDLLEALAPFAEQAQHHASDAPEWRDSDTVSAVISIGDLRRAHAAIARATGEKETGR